MAGFDFNCAPTSCGDSTLPIGGSLDPRRLREECIIALKVYDACRQQDCLTEDELGPARAAECGCIAGRHYVEGEVIDPPNKFLHIPKIHNNT